MTTEKLREVHLARPFRPFTIRMGDGSSYRVQHPEWLAYAKGSRTAVLCEPDESMHVLDLLLLTAIDVDGAPAAEGAAA